jgi:hypothetical protein
MLKHAAIATFLSALSLAASAAQSSSTPMSFEKCKAVTEATIALLGAGPSDVARVVNTNVMTMTKIYVSDGSVIVTCSAPDQTMVVTQSSQGR